MLRIHVFEEESSREVYDITQTNDGIQSGDILIIEKEHVIGILDESWPVSFTVKHGEFHTPTDVSGNTYREKHSKSVEMAVFLAYAYDWEVAIAPPF